MEKKSNPSFPKFWVGRKRGKQTSFFRPNNYWKLIKQLQPELQLINFKYSRNIVYNLVIQVSYTAERS